MHLSMHGRVHGRVHGRMHGRELHRYSENHRLDFQAAAVLRGNICHSNPNNQLGQLQSKHAS